MANVKNVSFTTDYGVQDKQLERQQAIADMLLKQSQEPLQTNQMAGGYVTPVSQYSMLGKLAQALSAAAVQKKVEKTGEERAAQRKEDFMSTAAKYESALNGTPARSITQDPQEVAQAFDTEGMDVPKDRTMSATPGSRQAALAAALSSNNPTWQQFGMDQMMKKPETPFNKVDAKDFTQESVARFAQTQNYADLVPARKMEVTPGGSVYNPYTVTPGTNFNDPNKLIQLDKDGNPVVNQPLVDAKKEISKAGSTNVEVKTDVKTGESLAGQVGPMMKDSVSIAEGAVKQVDAAQRVVKAIDSGNVITGPGATLRLKGAQISQMLGIGGKDEAEKVANTRNTIRGFAELTLQGRQQMKGQGAITESEGKLAEKAMSGDIDDLTPAEIKQLAKASERSARFNYAEHSRKLKVMQENPALTAIAPFYQGPNMSPEATPPAAGGFSIRRLP